MPVPLGFGFHLFYFRSIIPLVVGSTYIFYYDNSDSDSGGVATGPAPLHFPW